MEEIDLLEKIHKKITEEKEANNTPTHIRLHPKIDLTKLINSLKGVSSRLLFKEFPEIKNKLWNGALWSPSYCLITTGQVTLDQLKKYVESQGEPKK